MLNRFAERGFRQMIRFDHSNTRPVWGLVLCICLLMPGSGDAETWEGDSLEQPLTLTLDFQQHNHALIRASQRSADYRISVFEDENRERVTHYDVSAHKAVDEVVLVSAAKCKPCSIQLSGVGEVNSNASYQLTVEYLQTVTATEFTALQAINESARLYFQAAQPEEQNSEKHLRRAVELLEPVVNQQLDAEWVLHAAFLQMQLLGTLRDMSRVEKLARRILAGGGGSLYGIQALYQLGRLTPNTIEKRNLFKQGMAQSKESDEPVLYAKGANYLAINLVRDAQFDEALALFEEVYSIYAEARHWSAMMNPLHNLSWANQRAGRLPQSIRYAAQQKLLAEEQNDQENVIWALYNLAIAYGQQGERFAADQFLDQAIDRYQRLPEAGKMVAGIIYGYLLQERTGKSDRSR